MSQVDDNFVSLTEVSKSSAAVSTGRASLTTSMARSSFTKVKTDPYNLDFTQLRKDYVGETTVKIPFVKSSFIHYSKCPRKMVINNKEYDDLVLTMELIQAPQHLNYTQLEDPKKAMEKHKEEMKVKKEQMIKDKIRAKKQAVKDAAIAMQKKEKEERLQEKEERKREREERKAERAAGKEERKAAKEAARINGSDEGSEEEEETEEEDYDEEEESDDEEDSSEENLSDIDLDEIELDGIDFEDYGLELSEPDYGSEEDSGTPTESEDKESSGSLGSDEDREYTGDMFGDKKPIKYGAAKFEVQGQHNKELETNDYCCIALWSAGGKYMRYTRLKDTTMRVPPLANDLRFRVGHDCKRLYYIGMLEGKKKLVVVYLKDFSHIWYDLGDDADIETLEDSSLFKNFLCYKKNRKVDLGKTGGKLFHRFTKDFYVLDIKTQKIVWELPDCEQVFFKGKDAIDMPTLTYVDRQIKHREVDEPEPSDEDTDKDADSSDGGAPPLNLEDAEKEDIESGSDDEHEGFIEKCYKGIMVIKSSQEEIKIEAPKEKEKEKVAAPTEPTEPTTTPSSLLEPPAQTEEQKVAAEAEGAEAQKDKMQLRKYFRAYFPQWKLPLDKKRLVYETFIEVKKPTQSKGDAVVVNNLDSENEDNQLVKEPTSTAFEENKIVITSDNACMILALIVKGLKGEQHRVFMFNPENKKPLKTTNRAGNVDLEFNMNSHVRSYEQVFIVQTEPNGQATAKQLNFDPSEEEENAKFPKITFTQPMRGFPKDCWLVEVGGDECMAVMTICKSSTDEYLNADCVVPEPDSEDKKVKFQVFTAKIKAQMMSVNYPCLVSNLGLSRVMIQSLTCPDQVASFKLDEQKMEFICFADYQSMNDIGFKDKRDQVQADLVPFLETGDKVAFITRKFGVCGKDSDECQQGDMLLNVLSIDSYASPMQFELYTTTYEACMTEGMSDDLIQRAICTQVASVRGLDVAFVAQYNDRIIFDCITSTRQLPVRFPLPLNSKQAEQWNDDPDFNKSDCDFEQLDIAKGGRMVRQPMVIDEKGAIFFMMAYDNGTVKVLRTDPMAEMGGDSFVKTVFTLRSTKIFFLLFHQNQFYLMDDQKKVRVLQTNVETNMWKQVNTLDLPERDANALVYADYDEYCVSDGVLHCNDKLYFLLESKSMDNATWTSEQIMFDNHLHVSGPCYAKESGLIWYMQQHAKVENDGAIAAQDDDFFGMGQGIGQFKGYSVVMQPLGDLSFIDLLPQRGENNNNFITILNESHIMVNYSGRYLIFDLKGAFQGQVNFQANEGFQSKLVKLKNVSDSGKFFVFEGPRFKSKVERDAAKEKKKKKKEQMKAMKQGAKRGSILDTAGLLAAQIAQKALKTKDKLEKNNSGGKKAPIFYVFKLESQTRMNGKVQYKFMPYKTELFPFIEDNIVRTMTQRVNYEGVLSQCLIKTSHQVGDLREVDIVVKVYQCEDANAKKVEQERSFFSFGSVEEQGPRMTEERYRIHFNAESNNQKRHVLSGKIASEQKRVALGAGNKELLLRIQKRSSQIERCWVFNNYIIAKSGSELKYIPRETSIEGGVCERNIDFAIQPGAEVWIENVFSTGVENLVQLVIFDDSTRRVYLITWNLQSNREHSLYQTTYAPDVFPENLIIRGKPYLKQQDFNYFMDNGAIMSLDTNLPVQFFDMENEADTMPKGPLAGQIEGMRRISEDRSRYLDITAPGRVHHFISFADLLYWERFQILKDKHEISKGHLSSFSPIARFPAGISIFHYHATNIKVLSAVQDAMTIARQERSDDSRVNMLPLVFLHSSPQLNKPGKRTTPIHIALDKQSPISFETMMELLVDQHKVCVTSQLLDVLEVIINSNSQAVLDFFDNSFFITDQYAGLRALEWEDQSKEELITATSCAYLTDDFMQSLVASKKDEAEEVDEEMNNGIDQLLGGSGDAGTFSDAPFKYSNEVEPITHGADDSNLKQVEAKILDFNWVFIADNSARLTKILATTDNDEIFATAQIRIFVDFMWEGYFTAIMKQLFIPFIFYFVSFVAYTGFFSHHEDDNLSIPFVLEIICLVVFGKTYMTFLILEGIQVKNCGFSYFFDVWNMIDIASLALNFLYVGGEVTNFYSHEQLQVFASFALFLMWFKLFYWMRLFKPFSAFIRMITEIIKDVQVFLVMLIISLGAFANIIYVLNLNRTDNCGTLECAPIYDSLIGFPPMDAMIHAYLTGLGDFNKDNYSEENSKVVWFMFILATFIVQLIFMNLLIAIMGESFGRITAIMQQSTLKELCSIMEDHIWLQKIDELFENKRYILWLTPDTSTSGGTVVERQITQLKDQVKNLSESSEQRILRSIALLSEDIVSVKTQLEEALKKDMDDSD